ncbi:MAG: T9SS type A sorting domain-containing protein, partial [Ignavibacteria bacterium]
SALNSQGVSGPVRFLLNKAAFNSGETFPLTINITNSNMPSSVNTIMFKPNTDITSRIYGSSASKEIFQIKNSYVSFDGSNSANGTSRDLTIENTSTTAPIVIGIYSSGTTPVTNITFKNCTFINGSSSASASPALIFSNTSYTSGYFKNITIQNNNIKKAYFGISINGDDAAGNGSGTLISGNDLNSSGTDCITGNGIYVQGVDGATISQNNIGNFNAVNISSVSGITISSGTKNTIVANNIITGLTSNNSNSNSVYGIDCSGTNISIYNNTINNIKNTSTSGYSAIGIYLNSSSNTANICAYNNLIYDIAGYGRNINSNFNGYGINILKGGGYNIYHNSINLATNQSSAFGIPACLIIGSLVTAANSLDIRNNIFSIPATVGTNRYAVICNAANTVFSELNYNDYYTSGSNIGYIGSANKPDLSSWKTATGKDKFSINADPSFTGSEDLTINTNNPNCWNINGGAYPISSISTDFSNNTRRTSLPGLANDIGAYEFTPTVSPSSATVSTIASVTTISSSGNTLATITWTAGTAPTLTALYYPGENPSATPAGTKYGNSHLDITASGGSSYTYNIVYNFNPAMLGTITNGDYNFARLAKYSSGAWQYYSATPNGTNYTISVNGLTSFSNFALTDGNAPLPVKLSSFTSSVNSRDVTINWETISEHNNLGFDIERKLISTNEWTKVGSVKGNGTSNTEKSYSFEDKKLSTGKYNYRLKQTDFNNNFEYHNLSSEVVIASPSKFSLSQNYPNPFNPETSIDFDLPFDSKVSISIFDITGKNIKTIISESRPAGFHTIRFNASVHSASVLSTGIYFYRIIAESSSQTFISIKKMILVK